ncbi:MAG: monooxygenase [Phycisphaerae bacterium]|nr:monooxygenase [Phycisphaerae bacterium]
MTSHLYDVIIVGGGAAGIGVAVTLKDAGIENFLVLERGRIGASFTAWPEETRFLTPSFPTNSMGMLDLNSVSIGTSPAFSLQSEHPTGREFAAHLRQVAGIVGLPIRERTTVLRVSRIGEAFVIDTDEHTLRARHVIWAAGEFQYPRKEGFPGSELCRHTATIRRYEDLEGTEAIVIGGYESGIDAAFHLASRGIDVRLFDRHCPWDAGTSDPSIALSTYSLERMSTPEFKHHVTLHPDTTVNSVTRTDHAYEVTTKDERRFETGVKPILASGFLGSHRLVRDMFARRPDGYPLLNEHDESTIVPGMFLCGPAVRHDDHVFCFIFKFRMRFAVVAKAIAESLGMPAEGLEGYRNWGMYLDDLSCCGEECIC